MRMRWRYAPAAALLAVMAVVLARSEETAQAVRDGLALALEGKGPDGAVCAFGSLYQAGEVRAYFGKT